MNSIRKNDLLLLALGIVVFAVLQGLISARIIGSFWQLNLLIIGINVIMSVSLNLINGYTGQFSLGHAGFMAIGAYSCAIITSSNPTYGGFIMGLLVGMLVSGIVAYVVGLPTLRLKGDYLAIATLGIAEIIRILIVNFRDITNGPSGIFGLPQVTTWEVVFVFALISIILVSNLMNSAPGRAILSVREDEIAAEAMGINTTKYKVLAFVIGAVLASIAGTLFASYQQSVFPKDYQFMKTIDILIIVVFGGIGSTTGAVLSAVVLGILNMYLQDFGYLRMILYALTLIIIMIFKPSGLLGTWEFSVKRIIDKFTKKGDDVNASVGR